MAKNLSNLRAPRKANTGRKRVGRGMGSGMGKTSARGHKGQGSRSGFSLMRGFEGGQMPLHRRLPKRGFTNIFRTEYTVVNLDRIAELKVTEIGLDDYKKLGLSSNKKALVKILGSGELKSAITIHAHKFSKSAVEKIEKAGGKALLASGEAVSAVAETVVAAVETVPAAVEAAPAAVKVKAKAKAKVAKAPAE
jgi:large subunit ribosomal protein L15